MNLHQVDMLLDHLQHASLDDTQWECWTGAAVDAFGADGGTFLVLDAEQSRVRRQHEFYRRIDAAAMMADYASGPCMWDPALDEVANFTASETISEIRFGETSDPMHRAFDDWLRSWGIGQHHLAATLLVGPTLRVTFGLHWSPDHGPSRAEEIRNLTRLVPHLHDALRFGFQHEEILQASWWEGQEDVAEQKAVALVDEGGAIVRMSPAFEAIVRNGGWLGVSRGWLRAREPAADRALESAILRAVSGLEARDISVAIPQSPRFSARLNIKPVARSRRYLVPYQPAALLQLQPRALRHPAATESRRLILA